ncbi:hypothetical protein ZHAS_00018902 [Anopheles sinensis]|uniref:Uncharacterized protein n=1 Tax=Anopheles sinensis TaxID=74873 RepID=A0A084WK41_ANOSI|nr:hypothetical protein ZHAS_00018902 [Anopheles sinensis]
MSAFILLNMSGGVEKAAMRPKRKWCELNENGEIERHWIINVMKTDGRRTE